MDGYNVVRGITGEIKPKARRYIVGERLFESDYTGYALHPVGRSPASYDQLADTLMLEGIDLLAESSRLEDLSAEKFRQADNMRDLAATHRRAKARS